jgi:lipopolysaccharide export system permease protein
VITLAKLSNEYELIVLTSFGLNPIKIMKMFFPITF